MTEAQDKAFLEQTKVIHRKRDNAIKAAQEQCEYEWKMLSRRIWEAKHGMEWTAERAQAVVDAAYYNKPMRDFLTRQREKQHH